MKRWLTLAALVFTGICVWLLFFAKPPRRLPHGLDIEFTCDVRGRLVPCGCFTGQFGGLTRIATFLRSSVLRVPGQPEPLKVDVGDAIAGGADFERIEYRYIQQAFAKMGYEALNAGHREALLSAAQLREIKAHAPVTMLGANLIDKASGAPIFDTHKIVLRSGWRVALVGVMDAQIGGDELGEGLAVEPMDVALGKLLPKLREEADFIVLLAFADEAEMAVLARQFYELNVILGGRVHQPSQQLVRENRSVILATTNEARAVGILHTAMLAKGRMGNANGEVVLVSDRFPQDEEIAALATAYRAEVRGTKLAIDDPAKLAEDMVPGVRATAAFAGTQSCAACHATAAKTWLESGHARAFATLVAFKAEADPNCIACHTVGFGTASGYRREFGEAKLVDVGCESCHGPGSAHVAARRAGGEVTARFHPVGAGDCRKCHHGEFSRPFEYDKFWPAVAHGKEAAAKGK